MDLQARYTKAKAKTYTDQKTIKSAENADKIEDQRGHDMIAYEEKKLQEKIQAMNTDHQAKLDQAN